jgi:hypothetical protein
MVMSALSDDLSAIGKAADTLNALTDQATQQILQLEGFLAQHPPGVDAWVTVEEEEVGDNQSYTYSIGYDRLDEADGGKEGEAGYRLLCQLSHTRQLGEVSDEEPGETETKHEMRVVWTRPLADVPRDVRIAALAKLPELVREIAHTLREANAQAARRLQAFQKALADLKCAFPGTEANPQ